MRRILIGAIDGERMEAFTECRWHPADGVFQFRPDAPAPRPVLEAVRDRLRGKARSGVIAAGGREWGFLTV